MVHEILPLQSCFRDPCLNKAIRASLCSSLTFVLMSVAEDVDVHMTPAQEPAPKIAGWTPPSELPRKLVLPDRETRAFREL